jgi:hypothetical protein
MATKKAPHVFKGGMVKDLDKSLIPKERYLEARNFRLQTGVEGESTGALENIEGNNSIATLVNPGTVIVGHTYIVVKGTATYNNVAYTVGQYFTVLTSPTTFSGSGSLAIDTNEFMNDYMYVAGSSYIRDTLVLFLTTNTTENPIAGNSRIIKLTINDATETTSNVEILYDDQMNESTGLLTFSTAHNIRTVGVYETPTVQKVYWCDGYNNMRYINIAGYSTTNRLAYTGTSNHFFSPDLLEFMPRVTLTKPTLDYLVAGNIKAGMVQYAYQYYTTHGAESVISPLSDLIPITGSNDYGINSILYKGSVDSSETTGKGVKIQIALTDADAFTHLRVIRLHYETVNAVPSIYIVGEMDISAADSSMYFTDAGTTTFGVLTLDEFSIGSTELFSAKDISTKVGRLFAANIVKHEFDVTDWDARAVRFRNVTAVVLANVYDNNDGQTAPVGIDAPTADSVVEWNNAGWSNYSETHDGINKHNDASTDGDTNSQYIFTSDGTTVGAEGPNIKITLSTETMLIDTCGSSEIYAVTSETTDDNKSFTSYASPYLSGSKRSWMRDEVYRLYIVFFDDRGRSSSAKWVCDFRMPSRHDATYGKLFSSLDTNYAVTRLFPIVTLKRFPAGAVAAQLLRVPREGQDRGVLTQAFVIPTATGATQYPLTIEAAVTNSGIVKLVSPEINITNNVSKGASDYLDYICHFTGIASSTAKTDIYVYKTADETRETWGSNCITSLDTAIRVAPRAFADPFSVSSFTCKNYNDVIHSYGSTGLFVHYTNGSWTAIGDSFAAVNYKRDVHQSQYGGQTYEARSLNNAIPASELIKLSGVPYYAYNGDTFINYFDVSPFLFDLKKNTAGSKNQTIYVALESSINCDLRHDHSMNRTIMYDAGQYPQLLQEVSGKWTNGSGIIYEQPTSLYQYNTVYSQDNTAKYFVNVSDDVSTDTNFDCMIRTSKVKLSGEGQDNWLSFPVNNFIEVSADKGAVTTLALHNDKLMFWQENAFGMLAVNERSLIKDSGGIELSLGTGGVLDRYDYISDSIGVADNNHFVQSKSATYWIDSRDKSMYVFNDSLANLSKSMMMGSWLEEKMSPTQVGYLKIRLGFDPRFNQVLASFYNTNTASGEILVYDEVLKVYTAFYDYWTYKFIPYRSGYLTTCHLFDTDHLFFQNSRLKERCSFYSVVPAVAYVAADPSTLVESSVKVLFNDDYSYTKVFDNLSFVAYSTKDDVELYSNTFQSIRCYNNYQNTDYCDLIYGTTLERDEREWTTFVPRNAVDQMYTSSPDIFNAGNIDKTRTFRERIRDKYMITDFVYTNTDNRRFVVPFVVAKYRLSYR